ncbi:MAG TPA: helix-turn-helix transcriptional regulator [Actinomycetes bacterium]
MPNAKQRDRLGGFLRIRRGALQPEDVGLPKRPNRRLTPGLRREEVAELAGISVSWYTRLEQGKDVQLSARALHGIAAALKLNAPQRDYLLTLARNEAAAIEPAPPATAVSPTLRAVLDAQGERPAYIVDACLNLLAWNRAANDVFGVGLPLGDFAALPAHERNLLWLIFTDQARRLFVQWERHARLLLAQFRDASRHFVGDPWIERLVERLERRSPEFALWWAQHDVQRIPEAEKVLDHPKVGQIALRQTVSQIIDDGPGLFLVLYTPAPGTDTAERLQKLAIDSAGS